MSENFNENASTAPRRKRSPMEFNFIVGRGTSARQLRKKKSPESASPAGELSDSIKSVSLRSKPEFAPLPREENPPMSTTPSPTVNPSPIRSSGSMQRQVREQRTVNTVLNGVALALICGVLLVAALAATGGYVLWKQLQDQSVSLALLEQNTKDRMFDLKAELVANDADISKTLEQSNLRLVELTTQFESYRSETAQMLAELKANNRSLERSLSLYQKKTQDQEIQLAQIRRTR